MRLTMPGTLLLVTNDWMGGGLMIHSNKLPKPMISEIFMMTVNVEYVVSGRIIDSETGVSSILLIIRKS